MASLDRSLRKELEKTVRAARRAAEDGARKAVAQLGVGDASVPDHLSADERALRNKLRAHGRQLGDRRDQATGSQETARLVQECAYAHWHRMLFARFLAEAGLLIEPEAGVAVSLDEVQELAREKATDWLVLACDYAERMLPQIFRKDDPVLQIPLPRETRSEMEDLLGRLPAAVFDADDSLGWVYQFWQADTKDAVNKSEVKIGADELPSVTQLFTEDYMVLFLLHNTLGAWWAGKVLAGNPRLAASAPDEAALRAACKVGDIDWTYLRFVRDTAEDGTDGPWRPAAGAFEGWPKTPKELTVLDPCMGSGHFLVFALPILVAFRMAEEALSQSASVDAVLKENLFGLEIDPRCTQIAAFNLAFAAWRKVGHRPLPQLNLACSGLAIGVTKAEWLKLAEKAVTAADPAAKRDLLGIEKSLLTVGLEERVKNGLGALYDLFAKAPWLGSLIDPRRAGGDIFREGFDKLEPLLSTIMAAADTDESREMAVAAQGMAKAAELLSRQFTLVVTNVPYLGRGKQDETIRTYCEQFFDTAKADLATCFVERGLAFCANGGAVTLVTPQNWLFLTSYKSQRVNLLKTSSLNCLALLGAGAFDTIAGEVVNVALVTITDQLPKAAQIICGVDCIASISGTDKSEALITNDIQTVFQKNLLADVSASISLEQPNALPLLSKYGLAYQGIATADNAAFILSFWEIPWITGDWKTLQSAPPARLDFGGRTQLLRSDFLTRRDHRGNLSGSQAWGKYGIAISETGRLFPTLHLGDYFVSNCHVLTPHSPEHLAAIWCYAESGDLEREIRKRNKKIAVKNGYFGQVPFDLAHWQKVAANQYPKGLPEPCSDDPTQWLFHGHPAQAEAGQSLQVAFVRLFGFRWPAELDSKMRLSTEARAWITKVGALNNACPPDADGIVCLTAAKGEAPASERLTQMLAGAFGSVWTAAKLSSLLAEAGYAGKSLDDWLRDGFFAQHCELFQHRPFIWHIWDGRRDGFHALVNYHRLAAPNGEGRRTLEKLIYSYLGDWIDRQRADQKASVEGADARLAHAEHLKAELIKILEGEPPYDIFVRWKPLHEQPLGWDPDINDGVRMNIRPFMAARTLNSRGANACILRGTPKIKWDKDRGKEPNRDKADYPWFWGWDGTTSDFAGGGAFDGNRWNDLHYTRAAKQAARTKRKLP